MRRDPVRGIVACGMVGVALAAWLARATPQSPSAAPAAHAVLIGIDGLTPAGLRAGDQGTFGRLMKEGAFSLTARAVFPTVSSPNWASMKFHGSCGAPGSGAASRYRIPSAPWTTLRRWPTC